MGKMTSPKLVYGVGVNDADYNVQKSETTGYGGRVGVSLGFDECGL